MKKYTITADGDHAVEEVSQWLQHAPVDLDSVKEVEVTVLVSDDTSEGSVNVSVTDVPDDTAESAEPADSAGSDVISETPARKEDIDDEFEPHESHKQALQAMANLDAEWVTGQQVADSDLFTFADSTAYKAVKDLHGAGYIGQRVRPSDHAKGSHVRQYRLSKPALREYAQYDELNLDPDHGVREAARPE